MESIEAINKRLRDYFGLFEDGEPNFRISWSDDQYEPTEVWQTKEGFHLLQPIIENRPKYPYLKHTYLLEKRFGIGFNHLVQKSYECIWAFRTDAGDPVPPKFEFIKLLIDQVLFEMNRPKGQVKYVMPELEKQTPEAIEERVKLIEQQLFGNETSVGDALAHDSGVGYGVRNRNDSRFKKVH